tara:strand:- start:1556 stop:2818 length:1263 start_codon:yes stop_codon:yes gene_type:complete
MTPQILNSLKDYSISKFWSDFLAGITVAMVALPLSIAIAIASGAEPEKGLITAIIGGFLISLFGGSRVQIGGPTGAFIVVVFSVIAEHGYDGLILATFMAGLILIIAGFLKAGSLISYIPEAVVNGFTIGIAIIIATSQVPDFLGLKVENLPADFLEKVSMLWASLNSYNPLALIISLMSVALMVIFRRLVPRLPGLIIAVALTSFIAAWLTLPVDTIHSRFGTLPDTLPTPQMPDISFERIIELIPSALVIAFLAGVESLLSAMVADKMIGSKHKPNAEILAQGIANLGSSLFGGMPATGAIARTATNIKAGGQTPISGLIHALIILLAVLLIAPLASYMAMPALAGLLVLTAWHMSEPHKWKDYLKASNEDKTLLLITLILTVVADLTIAIGIGVSLGLALRLRRKKIEPANWNTPKH